MIRPLVIAAALLGSSQLATEVARAGTIWDEAVDGDLSDNALAPTSLGVLTVGDNFVSGSLVRELDAFTIEVAAGYQLDSLFLVSGSSAGPVFPNFFLMLGDASGPDVGSANLGSVSEGADIFQSPSFFSAPYSAPLPPGVYMIDFRGFGLDFGDYVLNFHLTSTAVPEPSALAMGSLAVLAVGCLGLERGRRNRGPLTRRLQSID